MIAIEKVQEAAKMIKGKVIRTPLVYSPSLSQMFNGEIYLKLENLQKTGSFKIRGATYSILMRKDTIGSGGVVAASAGNHAQGVALAARQAGLAATIVMPGWASITKQEATRGYGGKVILEGRSLRESINKAQKLAVKGKTFIHPYDDPYIVSGQGTIALEILEDLKDTDLILVPVGGGGLISGIAAAAKSIRPELDVIGVQTVSCPSAYESWKKGEIVRVESQQSIADGISVKEIGKLNFDIIRRLVNEIVLVEEDHIAASMLLLLERKKTLAEGAGAVSLAALLNGSIADCRGRKVVLLISGGNVDSPLLGRILSQGLIKNRRIMRFRVRLQDTPGSLVKLLALISDLNANVLHVYHDRNIQGMPLYVTRVDLEIETRGPDHLDSIIDQLNKAGYDLEVG
jgi:threonine dehydratase